jgi:hypothetical protein
MGLASEIGMPKYEIHNNAELLDAFLLRLKRIFLDFSAFASKRQRDLCALLK